MTLFWTYSCIFGPLLFGSRSFFCQIKGEVTRVFKNRLNLLFFTLLKLIMLPRSFQKSKKKMPPSLHYMLFYFLVFKKFLCL
jgi:hypothetical protein